MPQRVSFTFCLHICWSFVYKFTMMYVMNICYPAIQEMYLPFTSSLNFMFKHGRFSNVFVHLQVVNLTWAEHEDPRFSYTLLHCNFPPVCHLLSSCSARDTSTLMPTKYANVTVAVDFSHIHYTFTIDKQSAASQRDRWMYWSLTWLTKSVPNDEMIWQINTTPCSWRTLKSSIHYNRGRARVGHLTDEPRVVEHTPLVQMKWKPV